MGPSFGTMIWPNVIRKIKLNSSDMNEIILAPCDVINKIKQNSSDINDIILAPCDAGYVQSCTGLDLVSDYMVKKVIFEKIEFFIKNKNFQKVLKLKIYYAKWTLRIEVVNGKKIYLLL
jgi:hypothetical protein